MTPVQVSQKRSVHGLALEIGDAIAVNLLDRGELVLVLPGGSLGDLVHTLFRMVGEFAFLAHHADFDDIEDVIAILVFDIGELAIEIEAIERRRDAYQCWRGSKITRSLLLTTVFHFKQRHNHFVEYAEIHVGGLFAIDHISSDALERVRKLIDGSGLLGRENLLVCSIRGAKHAHQSIYLQT